MTYLAYFAALGNGMQEKAQETERQMTDLTAEMDRIQAETKKLEERNQLLEKVLSLSKIEAPAPSRGPLELVRCFCMLTLLNTRLLTLQCFRKVFNATIAVSLCMANSSTT